APLAVAVGVLTVGLLIAAPKIRLGAAPENASNAGGEPAAGVARCPSTFQDAAGRPHATREGALAPEGATGALLCTYGPQSGSAAAASLPLTESKPISGSPARLVTYLNSLKGQPPAVPAEASPGTEYASDACLDMVRASYEIVLSYPDRPPVTVGVFPNCGVMEQDGVVRYLSSLRTLLAFWR
ncbi:MAG: hypothetical protein ACM30G_16720, partial [Micromonosporaceae bacterium]